MYVGSNESTTLSSFFSSLAFDVSPVVDCDCCGFEGDSPSTKNSLKNLTVASTSGVEPPTVLGTAPRCAFRSRSSLKRFQNGGECTSSWKTAFAKHIFLEVTSPRRRRRGRVSLSIGQEVGMEEPMKGGPRGGAGAGGREGGGAESGVEGGAGGAREGATGRPKCEKLESTSASNFDSVTTESEPCCFLLSKG